MGLRARRCKPSSIITTARAGATTPVRQFLLGLIEAYSYNSTGVPTDTFVKNGESGTTYYVSAKDYGDSVNATLVTPSYDF
jgi:hypothetical protein